MKDKSIHHDRFENLRQKAESIMNSREGGLDDKSSNSIPELIHELEVYQIELEMQNQQLRETQEELEVHHRRYEDLYEYSPYGYFSLNNKGIITSVNLAGVMLFNVDREVLTRSVFSQFIDPDFEADFFRDRTSAGESGSKQSSEIKFKRTDGSIFWGRMEMLGDMDTNGALNQLRIAVIDITKQKDLEDKLLNYLNEKENLLRELQHRVKNSFSIVGALVNLELNDTENAEIKNTLDKIHTRISSLSELYSIMSFSGRSEKIRLNTYCYNIIDSISIAYLGSDNHVNIVKELSEVHIDVNKAMSIGLILNELLTNSCKYAFPDNRNGNIRVSLKNENNMLILEVSDDGIEMTVAIEGIMSGRKFSGLNLVEKFSKQHNGKFEIESGEKKVFRVSIPLS